MKAGDWQELRALVDAVRQAEETRLASIGRRMAELDAALSRLEESANPQDGGGEAYVRSGGNLRWQAWTDARKTELLTDLAHLRYRQAVQTEATRHATARALATDSVWRDAARSAAREEERRRDRDG